MDTDTPTTARVTGNAPWIELCELLGPAVHPSVEINPATRVLTAHMRPIGQPPVTEIPAIRRWAFEVLTAAIERVEQSPRWLVVDEMDIHVSVDEVQSGVFTLDGVCQIPPKFRVDATASLSAVRAVSAVAADFDPPETTP